MMDQFKKLYWPGGMGLDYSAWWLCTVQLTPHGTEYRKVRKLATVTR